MLWSFSRAEWCANPRQNMLAGLTIAFALVAHLKPLPELYGAVIICALPAMSGGRPGRISGAAGSMAVVIVALVVQHGVDYLLATVVLSGIFMTLSGLLSLGKLIRMVPHPVMLGFVNGLAIVIAMSQLAQFHRAPGPWLQGAALWMMAALAALAAMAAIAGVRLASYFLHLPTRTLGDLAHIAGGLPAWHVPSAPSTDPARVERDCTHLHLADHSAIAAMQTLVERDEKAGRHLHVVHRSGRNQALLMKAGVDAAPARCVSAGRARPAASSRSARRIQRSAAVRPSWPLAPRAGSSTLCGWPRRPRLR